MPPISADKTTIKVIANFAKGNWLDQVNSGVNPPTGFVSEIPDLWALNEFEIVVHCYEYYSASEGEAVKSQFGDSCTAKLYIKQANTTGLPTELCTGTIAQNGSTGNYYILTFSVAAAALLAAYANQECLLYFEVTGTGFKRTGAQLLNVLSDNGTEDPPAISATPLTVTTLLASATITATPGPQVVFLDGTSAAVAATLPAADAYTSQEIAIIAKDVTNDCTFVGTVNGQSGPFTLAKVGDSARLVSNGTSWFNLNPVTVIAS